MALFDRETDPEKEKRGVDVPFDDGDFVVTIKRAGGTCDDYSKVYERECKPVRRALKTGTITDKQMHEILYTCVAEGIVVKWRTLLEALPESEWTDDRIQEANANKGLVVGIDMRGKLVEDTVENRIEVFRAIPDLMLDLLDKAKSFHLFTKQDREVDAKN